MRDIVYLKSQISSPKSQINLKRQIRMTERFYLPFRNSIIKNYLVFGACHLLLIHNTYNLNYKWHQIETLPNVAQNLSP
jgi:hypothetical protein